ncbi:ABC transporter ATP-binding protein [Candidatus Uhrbacteria bacterium]|nr:ABC transporter ATP-binding protein [Candidatus Uhrbacteria bacterium]
MLTATNLKKSFGGVAAVDHASCTIEQGKITALIGPNGAGKTTFFNLLSGTIEPDAGSIILLGEDLTTHNAEERARHGISRSFQLSRPFRNLTVAEHLLLALDDEDDQFWKSLFNDGKRDQVAMKRVHEVMKMVGLDVPASHAGADLSYGQGKLLGIAMALIHPHRLMLLDEPVAGVNPVIREAISSILMKLREEGETIFVIEHDMGFIMPLADQVIVMDHGKILAQGTPEQIKRNPEVLHAYLGQQL